jgi:hypothetical protein
MKNKTPTIPVKYLPHEEYIEKNDWGCCSAAPFASRPRCNRQHGRQVEATELLDQGDGGAWLSAIVVRRPSIPAACL